MELNYNFNNMGRIGMDAADNTQRNIQNIGYENYVLADFFSNKTSNSHVDFSTKYPTMMSSGIVHGSGLIGSNIDVDTQLMYGTVQSKPLDKLQLNQRPFLTVPYLGRGSCDPTLESQLQQGNFLTEPKNFITEQSFIDYTLFPKNHITDERYQQATSSADEIALSGWVRGGSDSRPYN